MVVLEKGCIADLIIKDSIFITEPGARAEVADNQQSVRNQKQRMRSQDHKARCSWFHC